MLSQDACFKQLIDMSTELRIKAKNEFVNHFFKFMNYAVLGNTMKNVSKHREIKIVATNRNGSR